MKRRILMVLAVAILGAVTTGWAADPVTTTPGYSLSLAPVTVPAFFEDRVFYYNSFDGPAGRAEINTNGLQEPGEIAVEGEGLFGSAARCAKPTALALTGPALSPERAISLSMWWCLTQDAEITAGLQVFQFEGKGIISNFVRGKGEWCALPEPAAVFQVYYFPGISNVNGIYDRGIWDRGQLKAGMWHHTVLTIAAASSLHLYMDGELVAKVDIQGRTFGPQDALHKLMLGNYWGDAPLLVDEVMLLDRALTAQEVSAYHTLARQMKAVAYPVR